MDTFDKIDKFNAINEAICYWLGYQFKIGRERLIHEASLRYPIADTLTAKNTLIDNIQLEKGHPCFADRLVDVVVFDKAVTKIDDINSTNSISEIYELKLAKRETGTESGSENQRVIDDILRLAYFNQSTGKDAYFLICGKYQDFKNYFIGQKDLPKQDKDKKLIIKERNSQTEKNNKINNPGWNTEKSLYKDYFDFEFFTVPRQKEYTFIKKDSFGLDSFQDRYKIKENMFTWSDSIKIKTTCMTITPFESVTYRTHACGIWKIEGEK